MINEKYFNDIAQFPAQFEVGLELAKGVHVKGSFSRVLICGMGGSASYGDLLRDYLRSSGESHINIVVNRSYTLPEHVGSETLCVVSSYSGNTEEALSCFEEIREKKLPFCVITAGGKLLEMAQRMNVPLVHVPQGLQPRLSSGYFIAGLVKVLENAGSIQSKDEELCAIADNLHSICDTTQAKELAQELFNTVPILYATDNNKSIAKICKIKLNENSKTQSFYNHFPELNHNEMVGFTNLVMNPHFILFKSKFTHPRNHKRIEIFAELMKQKNIPVTEFEMEGGSTFAEMMHAYHFIDYVSYYLAEAYNVDPEAIAMVEDFKKQL